MKSSKENITKKAKAAPKKTIGRPPQTPGESKHGKTLESEVRKTYIVNSETVDKINSVAFHTRKMVKEVVDEAFTMYLNSYEKKNGPIKLPGK